MCPVEEKDYFLYRHVQQWYPQALCFANRDEVVINKNWFMSEYSYPTIGISYCKNTTENNNWCKSKDEIDQFLLQ